MSAGAPTISGTARAGSALTAATGGVFDADGLDDAVFSDQWNAYGTAIDGATVSSCTLTEGVEGPAITVTVTFADDAGHEESLTSAATAAVVWAAYKASSDRPRSAARGVAPPRKTARPSLLPWLGAPLGPVWGKIDI